MANPFEVRVPNALEALMAGRQGYDYSQKMGQQNALSDAGRLYAAGDVRGAQAAASRGGQSGIQLLMNLAQQQNNERDFAFRQEEAKRAQGNTDVSLDLQERQIAATAGNTAAQQALARAQFEFQKEQGTRSEIKEDIDPSTGQKRFFLVNRKDNSVAPLNMPGGTAPSVPAPPIPPGVDPTTYRKEQAEAAVKEQVADKGLREGGQMVMGMIDQLEKKIINPSDPKVAKNFSAAAGPFIGPASDASAWDPRKWAYEAGRTRESKAYLDQIKQDAQAVNSTMQRAILKGGGSITNDERAQVNDILGKITQARSPEDAKALLDNFRGIARRMFKLQDVAPQQASNQPVGVLPPPPAGFVVQQ